MNQEEIYRRIPGKAGNNGMYLPLQMHLADTASVMEFLCHEVITDAVVRAAGLEKEDFLNVAVFLAGVHDIGKMTPLFASTILQWLPSTREILRQNGLDIPNRCEFPGGAKSPHALAGEVLLRGFDCPDGICAVVGAHHGKPTESSVQAKIQFHTGSYYKNYYASQPEVWQAMQGQILDQALQKSGYCTVRELPNLTICAQMLLCGLLIQADWIASNQNYFSLIPEGEAGAEDAYPMRTQRAWERLSLPGHWQPSVQALDDAAKFRERFGFLPNTVQEAAMGAAKEMANGGLLLIEAQMGVGKTEAALAAAEQLAALNGCGGMYFGLPTQATSNGVFPRITQWAEGASKGSRQTIRLVHGMAELNEDYRSFFKEKSSVEEDGDGDLTVHSWFSGRKQALLADFVVGTVDTALMAALKQKHVMLRHLGLCGKVVIIDECHAYDAYMSCFLLKLLQWLGAYHVPVILLSATLPQARKQLMLEAYAKPYRGLKGNFPLPDVKGYPLLTWSDGTCANALSVKETATGKCVDIRSLREENIAEDIRNRLCSGGCVGIIVNTVKRVQELARCLREQLPDKTVIVYHAQFIAEERIRREKELMERIGKHSLPRSRDDLIVVGTQVLEQSLDIDFDYLITDLCPMDLLLQRIGRLHRHERTRPASVTTPCCAVLGAEGEYDSGSRAIYGQWLLQQTRRYLPENIRLPDDIPTLVDRVYAEPPEEEKDAAWEEFRTRTEISEGKAYEWCLPRPKNSTREVGNSIVGLLDHAIQSEQKAEASVRDTLPSIDVLVMCRVDDDHVGFMPWMDREILRCDTTPSEEEARQIALQRLKLPFVFSVGKKLEETVDALENDNKRILSQWQESPWLKGELILLLDENGERELCGYHIRYEKDNGLQYERSGE